MLGLNRTDEEREAGIFRLEIVAQRDGAPEGRALFKGSAETQRFDELTSKEIQEYNDLYLPIIEDLIKNEGKKKNSFKNGNGNGNGKEVKKGGDI